MLLSYLRKYPVSCLIYSIRFSRFEYQRFFNWEQGPKAFREIPTRGSQLTGMLMTLHVFHLSLLFRRPACCFSSNEVMEPERLKSAPRRYEVLTTIFSECGT